MWCGMALDPVSGVLKFSFSGVAGKASISLPGAQVGDVIVRVWSSGTTSFVNQTEAFEQYITVADEIQLITYADLSGQTVYGVLLR